MKQRIAIFSALVTCFLFGCASQKSLFNKAEEKNTIEAYEEYLQKYPDGDFVNDAKSNIAKIELNKAKQANAVEALEQFLVKYPEGTFADSARANIMKLHFAKTESENSIAAYERFLEMNPSDNNLTEAAKNRIVDLEFENATSKNSISALEDFVTTHPNSRHNDEARKKIVELAFADAAKTNTVEAYIEFWAKYKDDNYIAKIQQPDMQNKVKTVLKLKELENADFDQACSIFVDFVKENESEIKTTYRENVKHALDNLSRKSANDISQATMTKMGYLDSVYDEKDEYESLVLSEILFAMICKQQEDQFNRLRNSGFSNISRNMGSYQASMKQLNEAKTAQIAIVLLIMEQTNDSIVRMRGWQAIEQIIGYLDLEKLKEKDEGTVWGMKLGDMAKDINTSYKELKSTLTKVRSKEKDKHVTVEADKVLAAFK